MRVLIVEDEPIIALDLEDTVRESGEVDVYLASSLAEARDCLRKYTIDFALLDVRLSENGETSLPIANDLSERRVPFCFVSSTIDNLPHQYDDVPKVMKPFQHSAIRAVLPPNGQVAVGSRPS